MSLRRTLSPAMLSALDAATVARAGARTRTLDLDGVSEQLPRVTRVAEAHASIQLERAILTDWPDWDWLPYAPDMFDTIVVGTHLQDCKLLGWHLAQLATVLRPGGAIVTVLRRHDADGTMHYTAREVAYHAKLGGYDVAVLEALRVARRPRWWPARPHAHVVALTPTPGACPRD